MDKQEYKLRSEEIKNLVSKKKYVEAMQVADAIDWSRVRSVMMLTIVSDIYKVNRRYEDSKDILLLAYERHPGGRTILYALCELSIKMEDFFQAVEYYKEFVNAAPKDTGRYILQYKLYEAQEVSLEERISVLEEFKKRDYREKWAYELAYMYHRIGLSTKCVEECDELILWFGEGKYVTKAMELKMLHEPLTPMQQEKYERRNIKRTTPVVEEPKEDIYDENGEPEENAGDWEGLSQDASDDMDIQVKTMDLGQYNTINLQEELAASMHEMFHQEALEAQREELEREEKGNKIVEAILAPMLAETSEISAEQIQQKLDELSGVQEVFFEDKTGDMSQKIQEVSEVQEETQIQEESQVQEEQNEEDYLDELIEEFGEKFTEESEDEFMDESAEIETGSVSDIKKTIPKQGEPGFARILSQEYDGQIRLVVPDAESIEKQITGQLSIEDIMAEWEKMKKEHEQRRMENVKKRVLEQTGALFTEFDAAVKADLMQDLETLAIEKEAQQLSLEKASLGQTLPSEEEYQEVLESEENYEEEMLQGEENYEEAMLQSVENYEEENDLNDEIYETEKPEGGYYEEADREEGEISQDYQEEEEPQQNFSETRELANIVAEGIEEEMEEEVSKKRNKPSSKKNTPIDAGREFTREEEEIFKDFSYTQYEKDQIIEAIDKITLAAHTGNVIIAGDMGTGTMTLAKCLIKEVQLIDDNFSGKVAKITGESLNSKHIDKTFAKLENGALLIEKANGLEPKTIEAINKNLDKNERGFIIIMEDTPKQVEKLLEKNSKILKHFNARIDIAQLDDDALVAYGQEYALSREYTIDELGLLGLHTRIADMQTSEHVVTYDDVEDILEEAIQHANRKTFSHLTDILFAKRYDEEDMIILKENDFINY